MVLSAMRFGCDYGIRCVNLSQYPTIYWGFNRKMDS